MQISFNQFIKTLLGFISVAFGAYAEHGLSKIVTDENFRFLMTAVRYNQVNPSWYEMHSNNAKIIKFRVI